MAVKQQKRSKPLAVQPPLPQRRSAIIAFLERHSRVLALALVALASARIVSTYTVFSPTSDEPAHIASGMEWLDQHVYTWEPQHPPLARVAAALGPYLMAGHSQNTPRTSDIAFSIEGTAILEKTGHFEEALALARLGILPFFWVACIVVYIWGRRYFGAATAVAAVFLFSFLPPVLAHAGLATTDMATTAFLGAAFLAGALWLEEPTRARAAWFGASTGLAVLSKFSVLAFFPASVAAALLWYFLAEKPGVAASMASLRKRLPTFAMAVAIACVLIWAGYRFSFGKVYFANIRLPAPELYQGIHDVAMHNAKGHAGFLLGQRTSLGSWDFFPVAIAVKTPLAFLALLGVGLALALRGRASFRRPWLAIAFSGGILAVGMASHINIGLRHVLPMYIGCAVLAGAGAVSLLESASRRKWAALLLAVLVAWMGLSSLLSHPDYLPYFNELAGSHPENILVDSDLDWGQDMKRLGARLRALGAHQLTYVPLFYTSYKEYGFPPVSDRMDVLNPQPGWTAVSLTVLKQRRMGLWDTYPDVVPWPDRIPPTERVGKSILLWYFPEPGAAR
jgi:4-amino-4-deoxy-L-arabinose transferase-like glycosyltransferase